LELILPGAGFFGDTRCGGGGGIPPTTHKIAKNGAKSIKLGTIIETHENSRKNQKNPKKVKFSRFYPDFARFPPDFSKFGRFFKSPQLLNHLS